MLMVTKKFEVFDANIGPFQIPNEQRSFSKEDWGCDGGKMIMTEK